MFCHGRKHDKIREVDYSSAIFIDVDPTTGPDESYNISKIDIEPTHDIDRIILMNCPVFIYSTVDYDQHGVIINIKKLRTKVFNNFKALLSENGKLYMRPFILKMTNEGFYKDNIDIVNKNLAKEGFVYEKTEILHLEDDGNVLEYDFLVYSRSS